MSPRRAGVAVAWLVLASAAAASASTLPHHADVAKLFAKDHGGRRPASDAELLPYSHPYEKLLAGCRIKPGDLTGATSYLAGQVGSADGRPFTTLMMLRAFARRVTWKAPRNCWDTFYDVQAGVASKAASTPIRNTHEIGALYVFDHGGASPTRAVSLVPYSRAFARIIASCRISAEDTTNLMIELSQKASELGARRVTTVQMMEAVVRRIDWKGKKPCWTTFDNAEAHMESGGP